MGLNTLPSKRAISATPLSNFDDLRGLRARGYVRDSTLDQRNGFGPDIQRQNILRFANNYGLTLEDRWYTEFLSGRSFDKRPEFQQFVRDAQTDAYDVLLVDHTSRFGRNQAECIRYKEQLQRLGKSVVFVAQGIMSGTDRDFLQERISETLDEQYSRNLSRYVAAGMAEKAHQGLANGRAPLGYRSVKEGHRERKVLDPSTLPTLKALLQAYATGEYSFSGIATHLNSLGFRQRGGKPFLEGGIEKILRNPFYVGKIIYHINRPDQTIVAGAHETSPEIVALWERCQEVRSQRRSHFVHRAARARHPYVFPGVLVCDACKARYRGRLIRSWTAKGVIHTYQGLLHHHKGCEVRPRTQGMERLMGQFAERVLAHVNLPIHFEELVIASLRKGDADEKERAEGIKRAELALERLRNLYKWQDITEATYLADREPLRRELEALKMATSVVAPDIGRAGELLRDLAQLWRHPGVSNQQRQRLLTEVFAEIRIRGVLLLAVRPNPLFCAHMAYLSHDGRLPSGVAVLGVEEWRRRLSTS